MPVPSLITDLSATESANSPLGSEAVGTGLDNYIRAHASFIKQLYDSKANLSGAAFTGAVSANRITATAQPGFSARRGTATVSGVNSTLTDIVWDAEIVDRTASFDGATFTVPAGVSAQPAILSICICGIFSSSDPVGAFFETQVSVNGNTNLRRFFFQKTQSGAESFTLNYSETLSLNSGDTIKARSASSTANAVTISGVGSNFFTMAVP